MSDDETISPVALNAHVPATAAVFRDDARPIRAAFAAGWIAEALRDVLSRQDRAVLALVGGSSVRDVHALLADVEVTTPPGRDPVDWSRVIITQADERAVPADSDERNWRVITPLVNPLVGAGRLPEDNIVALPDLPAEPSVDEVEAALDVMRDRVDRVDVTLLAAGSDGHCASLFPGHAGLAATGAFAVVTESPKPPPMRITMTVSMLAGASHSLLIGFGKDKASPMATVQTDGPLSAVPARIVHYAPNAVIVTDHGED